MSDLRDRLRDLDGLDVPDVMERANQIGPRTPMRMPVHPVRRVAVVAFALLLAAASVVYLSNSFERSAGPTPVGPPMMPSAPCRFDVSTIPMPRPSDGVFVGGSVAGTSLQDVWVLGATQQGRSFTDPRLLHYDGTTWTNVDLPADGSVSDLVAPAPGIVWGIASNGVSQWDGTAWTRTLQGSEITDLDVEAPDSVWATGAIYNEATRTTTPSVMHWDGTAWTTAYRAADGLDQPKTLMAVSAWATNDVWAVGLTSAGPYEVPVALHWDGTQWLSRRPISIENRKSVDVVAVGPDDALMQADEVVLRWDAVMWIDSGFDFPSVMDAPTVMEYGDDGVWAKIWKWTVGRWDGAEWRTEGLQHMDAWDMSVIGGDAVFVGDSDQAVIYSCRGAAPDSSA